MGPFHCSRKILILYFYNTISVLRAINPWRKSVSVHFTLFYLSIFALVLVGIRARRGGMGRGSGRWSGGGWRERSGWEFYEYFWNKFWLKVELLKDVKGKVTVGEGRATLCTNKLLESGPSKGQAINWKIRANKCVPKKWKFYDNGKIMGEVINNYKMILLLLFSISSTIRASNAQKPKPKNTLCACADFFPWSKVNKECRRKL